MKPFIRLNPISVVISEMKFCRCPRWRSFTFPTTARCKRYNRCLHVYSRDLKWIVRYRFLAEFLVIWHQRISGTNSLKCRNSYIFKEHVNSFFNFELLFSLLQKLRSENIFIFTQPLCYGNSVTQDQFLSGIEVGLEFWFHSKTTFKN